MSRSKVLVAPGRSPLTEIKGSTEHWHVAITPERLTSQDVANLLVEAPDNPMHMAVLTVFQGRGEVSADELLDRLRAHVHSRLPSLPELRRVLRRGRFPTARDAWVEDRAFRVEEHVRAASLRAPGHDEQLLAEVGDLVETMLDRSRPLWELWLLTGLSDDRWATLLKVHHSITDGYGMLQIAMGLFDGAAAVEASGARGTHLIATRSSPIPGVLQVWALFTTAISVIHRTWRGRRADLLHPLGTQRRVNLVSLPLDKVKDVAHAHGVKVNDVLLELATAGIRGVLNSRHDRVNGVVLRALMAVSPSAARRSVTHNRAASIVVSLPLEAATPTDRLLAIAADSRRARRWQRSGLIERSMVFVARTRLGRFLSRHQRVVDLAVSNLIGPQTPLYLLGDCMIEAIPITPISGNVTIDFCALSYAGRLTVGILADADAWPDLRLVAEEMQREMIDLGSSHPLPRVRVRELSEIG
jgi:diacylglycerol O-acyltransferase / wax synthase